MTWDDVENHPWAKNWLGAHEDKSSLQTLKAEESIAKKKLTTEAKADTGIKDDISIISDNEVLVEETKQANMENYDNVDQSSEAFSLSLPTIG